MNYLRVHAMLEEMIKAILNEQPGFAKVGNVWMEWDGEVLTWDIPLSEWDVEDVWQSLRERAKKHPDVDRIASCAHSLAEL
jgi:hypothetical protein